MTNDKVTEIIDIISEMIIKYLEDFKESQCGGEKDNLETV
jgi:hypothetical protein